MKIIREKQDCTVGRWTGWHILTVAEAGFSMLDIYARGQSGLDIEVIRQFADQVNKRDETGSLHPKAPISALPRRFFREQESSADPAVLDEFQRRVAAFLNLNHMAIRAQRVLVDFHVSPAPVPPRYICATEEVFRLYSRDETIQDVVVFT